MKRQLNRASLLAAMSLLSALGGLTPAKAATSSYEYDVLGRLVKVTEGTSIVRYLYDAAGNRTRKDIQTTTPTTITLGSATAIERQGSVVFTVTVGSASGTVNFYDGGTFIGSSQLVNGSASVEIIGLALGSHSITVAFTGGGSSAANSVTFPVRVVNLDWLPAVLEILLE